MCTACEVHLRTSPAVSHVASAADRTILSHHHHDWTKKLLEGHLGQLIKVTWPHHRETEATTIELKHAMQVTSKEGSHASKTFQRRQTMLGQQSDPASTNLAELCFTQRQGVQSTNTVQYTVAPILMYGPGAIDTRPLQNLSICRLPGSFTNFQQLHPHLCTLPQPLTETAAGPHTVHKTQKACESTSHSWWLLAPKEVLPDLAEALQR
jgi:hypothetical protein